MSESWFDRPVTVLGFNPICRRTIGRTSRAAEFLLQDWPEELRTKPKYRKALLACQEALEGALPISAARAAFVQAAREADLLLDESAV